MEAGMSQRQEGHASKRKIAPKFSNEEDSSFGYRVVWCEKRLKVNLRRL